MTSIFIGQNTLKTPIRRSNLLPNPESISLRNPWKNWTNTAAHPDCSVVEMDVVEGAGSKSSPILLTLFFRSCSSMFLFFLESDCRASIRDVFDFLYASLVPARYSRLFSVILTDNSFSFKNPSVFERKNDPGYHTLIFYYDPMTSWQKGRLEKNHEFIRYVLSRGKTFSGLTQAQATS